MPYKDPAQQREYQRQWMAARRAEYFAAKVCARCGSADQLELDHLDPTRKVTHRIWSWSAERRESELAKCQALCAGCHGAKTLEQMPITNGRKPRRHGSYSMYDRGCRCGLCRLKLRNKMRARRAIPESSNR